MQALCSGLRRCYGKGKTQTLYMSNGDKELLAGSRDDAA